MGNEGKVPHDESLEAFEEVCTFNNINPQVHDLADLQELELFQLSSVTCLNEFLPRFGNLTELCINHQKAITSVEGIGSCKRLVKLWVSDCSLETVSEELTQCTRLKFLNLSSNRISSLENITCLQNLDQLWLNENKIRSLDNISHLKKLRQLWIARNYVEKIGTSFDGLVNLEELNLAQNRIGSFRELLNLARLQSLRRLFLNDPHFGSNPVCFLSNYQTYVICHLAQLKTFDGLHIDEEAKLMTEATFLKKRMYYNMRIKTLKRNMTMVIRKAMESKQSVVSKINMDLNVLIQQQKETERYIHLGGGGTEENTPSQHDLLAEKANALGQCIDQCVSKIATIQQTCDYMQNEVREIADNSIQHLMLELETGGNIRLVEGRPMDPWYSFCDEFFRSRVLDEDYRKLGIGELKMTRVMKVHNRFLRNRFESRSESVKQACNANGEECNFEYMFFHENEIQPINEIIQEGFLHGYQYRSRKGHGGIPLQRCLFGFELSQQQQEHQQNSSSHMVATRFSLDPQSRKGKIILAKVCMGRTSDSSGAKVDIASENMLGNIMENTIGMYEQKDQAEEDDDEDDDDDSEKEEHDQDEKLQQQQQQHEQESQDMVKQKAEPAHTRVRRRRRKIHPMQERNAFWDDNHHLWHSGPSASEDHVGSIMPRDYPGYHTIFRESKVNSDYNEYYVFDRALVMPEYVIEFEYATLNEKMLEEMAKRRNSAALNDDTEFDGTSPFGLDFLSKEPLTKQEASDLGPLLRPFTKLVQDFRCYEETSQEMVDDKAKYNASINMPPIFQPRAKLALINEKTLLKWGSNGIVSSLANLTYLNLHACGLRSLTGLETATRLEVLVASFNEIESMANCFMNNHKLHTLELGFNVIRKIEGLENLKSLQTLELNNNLLYRLQDLVSLQAGNHMLRSMDFRNNAICESMHYRNEILTRFPKVEKLDGRVISQEERNADAHEQIHLTPTNIYRLGSKKPTITYQNNNERKEFVGNQSFEWETVQSLEINRGRIRKMENLHNLTMLRKLSLAENELTRMEGLECCTLLEELCLEGNQIVHIEGLDQCKYLKKLELGHNKLTRIENLEKLTSLTQLSLEDNEIHTLHGLDNLSSLMELYIGNNQIASLREIQNLRKLPKLIILDLLGNPISQDSNYRLYTIYYIKKLKVLDGIGVDGDEHTAAKERYAGKLTGEFLAEKIGDQLYDKIEELDLSGCKIRDILVNSLSGDKFPVLRELNLNNNFLTSLSGLSNLPNLQVLRLNKNKIETLGTRVIAGVSTGLKALPNLEVLQLGFNKVKDMSCLNLEQLPKLKVLFLQGNEISHFSGLENCVNLRELVLDQNKFRSLDDIDEHIMKLVNLRALRLEENSIRTLGNMSNLVKLHSLYLGFNRLSDITEIEKLSSIPFLLELNIANNPVTRKPVYRGHVIKSISNLKFLDGKEITQEERERVELLFQPETLVPPGISMVPQQGTATSLDNFVNGSTRSDMLSITGKVPSAKSINSTKSNSNPHSSNKKQQNGGGGGVGLMINSVALNPNRSNSIPSSKRRNSGGGRSASIPIELVVGNASNKGGNNQSMGLPNVRDTAGFPENKVLWQNIGGSGHQSQQHYQNVSRPSGKPRVGSTFRK